MIQSRRRFISCLASITAAASVRARTVATQPAVSGDTAVDLSAIEAVAAMRRGDLSAESYAESLLRRAEVCAELNAFITLDAQAVLEAARAADRLRASGAALGPLHGLPIPIKDSVNTLDLPTTGGTPALRHFRPKQDAPLVAALR